jgi:hypothetical protein
MTAPVRQPVKMQSDVIFHAAIKNSSSAHREIPFSFLTRRKMILFNDASKLQKSRIQNWKNARKRGFLIYNIDGLS